MSAVITNHQLLNNENYRPFMEKLFRLRINHAKDDMAGMAISTKIKSAQIQGLDQASRNASDGNSIYRPQTEL